MIKSILSRLMKRLLNREKLPCAICFVDEETFSVSSGTTILAAAKANDIDLDHFCGGTCSCSTCVVEIIAGHENLSKMEPREQLVLGTDKSNRGMRLSCQSKVRGPVTVKIPKWF